MLGVRIAALATLLVGVAFLSLSMRPADAGLVLVVDSTGDTSDANPGDGLCGTPATPDPTPTPPSPDRTPTPAGPGPFLAQVEPGTCTLRAAIEEANASEGHDTIVFSIDCIDFSADTTCGVYTIAPGSPLPAITDSATIEGPAPPERIVLSGAGAVQANGLILETRFSTIRRFVIYGFSGAGILIRGGAQNAIEGNFIGIDENGAAAPPNGVGIRVVDSGSNMIGGDNPDQRNVISGNAAHGVEISGADAAGNRLVGNYIGTIATGDASHGNGGAGVLITSPILRENHNVVGGGGASTGNVISGNRGNGVMISGGGANEVSGNYIGTDSTGSLAVPNEQSGVELEFSFGNEIGSFDPSQRNVISGNLGNGISILRNASGTLIAGNHIGTDASGTAAIPNDVGVFVGEALQNFIGREQFPRNVISGNRRAGVRLFGDSETYIQNNFIGTAADGITALPNDIGIEVRGLGGQGSSRIGGTFDGQGNVISGNFGFGIAAFEARGVTVQGNRIGTDATGTSALSNGPSGVLIQGGEGNLIGGDQPGAGNLISGSHFAGVTIFESYSNTLQGNLIGTDVTGAEPLGNEVGVHVRASGEFDSRTLIGGTSEGSRNVISGNSFGILTDKALNTTVQGNYIGTDSSGTQALRNNVGIDLASRFNTIGGTEPGARNVISGNFGPGVSMRADLGNGSSNVVQGNYIGVDSSGKVPLGNEFYGVYIAGLHDNLIGGQEAGAGNIIAGNQFGEIVMTNNAHSNSVQGNYIGTDSSGTDALGSGSGVLIQESSDNLIGGTQAGARNLISGNLTGIQIFGENSRRNSVQGNYIGTNASGSEGLTRGHGISMYAASDDLIGGTEAGARNVISGNVGVGVEIRGESARRNSVQGNFIGTDPSGSKPVGNGHGVSIAGAGDTLVGGLTPEARNVISGNPQGGVEINGGGGGNVVQGNLIGTNAAGSATFLSGDGVRIIHSPNNLIGGTEAGARNVLSGAFDDGIEIQGESATNNRIEGNYIGTDITGTLALGNEVAGIRVEAPGNTIGGTMPGSGNLISGNYSGILLGLGSDTLVQGNRIGTDVTGDLPLANAYEGVSIYNGPDNFIGGISAGEPNVIAFNGENGVGVHEPGAVGNAIRANSIHSNGLKGIETINGGNEELTPPIITSAGSAAGTACAGCTIDVYSDSEDEGRIYHGSTTADSGGNWSFAGAVIGPNVTATATDANGSTSEFSAPFACVDEDGDGVCNSGDPTPLGVCAGMVVTMRGTDGPDSLAGTPAADVIDGRGGEDVIRGGGGDDAICGGSGDDVIEGEDGDDTAYGEAGNDRLEGGKGADSLDGGPGSDRCFGGQGSDIALNCEKRSSIP